MWSSKQRVLGCVGWAESSFWSDVVRLEISNQGTQSPHHLPLRLPPQLLLLRSLAWPLCHRHSYSGEPTQTLYWGLKGPVPPGPCLLASFSAVILPGVCKALAALYSTKTWSSPVRWVSLHVLFPLEKAVSSSGPSDITLSEKFPLTAPRLHYHSTPVITS